MADRSVLVVVGSGSLARAVCYGLAAVVEQPVDVVVAARAAGKAAEVCDVAGARAALGGRPVAFRPAVADLARADEVAELLWRTAPVEAVSKLLAAQRAAARPELDHVTGYAGAVFLRDLLAGSEAAISLPGPLGLPGGYPVRLRGGRLALRLPPGLGETEAVAFNQRAALRDGAVVEGDRVRFGPAVQAELRPLAPDLVDGFRVADAAAAAAALHRLRDRLRTQPTS